MNAPRQGPHFHVSSPECGASFKDGPSLFQKAAHLLEPCMHAMAHHSDSASCHSVQNFAPSQSHSETHGKTFHQSVIVCRPITRFTSKDKDWPDTYWRFSSLPHFLLVIKTNQLMLYGETNRYLLLGKRQSNPIAGLDRP